MAYDCGTWLAKYLLCLFNFVFFLAGTAVLGIGIWAAAHRNSFITVTQIISNEALRREFQQFTYPTVIEQASYILIAAGAFVFVVSLIGYCGAIRESQCLLTCYGIFLVIILLMEITAGGLAAAYKKEAEEKTRSFLKESIKKYYAPRDDTDAVTLMWNYFMHELKCCGVDDYKDFADSKWKSEGKEVPDACCELKSMEESEGRFIFKAKDENCPKNGKGHYDQGCYDVFMEWIKKHTNTVMGVGIGLGLLQLLGIFLAFCLCRSIDGYIK